MDNLNDNELDRYGRQIILNEVGLRGQLKLKNARVLIIGCGGLGSSSAYYLASSGIGQIGLIDSDKVELNNLQRQILHFTLDVGKSKSKSAEEKLRALNPDINISSYCEQITAKNIFEIISNFDIIVDGTDNFQTRFLINDACVLKSKPFVHAGVLRFEGQVFTVIPHTSPCLRCLFPVMPKQATTCTDAGILGSVAGLLGIIQATEVIKYILNKGKLLTGRLLLIDALSMNFKIININKNASCPICGENPSIKELTDYESKCGS